MPILKMLRGPEPGWEVPLEAPELTIGRGRKNDIIIQDNEVSRTHCRLVRVLEDYEIHDLNSTNGTFVDGKPVPPDGWLLASESIVELGDSITFEYVTSHVSTGSLPPVPDEERPMMYLVIKQASIEQPEIYKLDRATIAMGRDVDNDIILQEPEVSRHHMRLIRTARGYVIEDLNTMNGTYVNDRRLSQQRPLHSNDMIRIGTHLTMWYTNDPDGLIENLQSGKLPQEEPETKLSQKRQTGGEMSTDVREVSERFRTALNPHLVSDDNTETLEPHQLEHTVLLVYAPEEWEAVAQNIYAYVAAHSVPIWAPTAFEPETVEWEAALNQAQHESPCLVAIISERSLRQPHIQRTVRHFLTRDKAIVLVQYGDVQQLPLILQPLPLIRYDADNPGDAYRSVLAQIRNVTL